MKKNIVIKVDVDTEKGTRIGVPNLISLFEKHRVKATFLFSLGNDRTGHTVFRIFRKGFLKKASRTNALRIYGISTLMNGLLKPAPHIAKKHDGIMRLTKEHGHEVGIHCYDHIRWQDHLRTMSTLEVREEVVKSIGAFQKVFGTSSKGIGSAGWQTNESAIKLYDEYGFLYSSDTRGKEPFLPVFGKRCYKTPQIPTNLATLDEVFGTVDPLHDYYFEKMHNFSAQNITNVMTIHAELEGMYFLEWFDEFLAKAIQQDYQFITLEEYAKSLTLKNLPCLPIEDLEIPGRSGTVACGGGDTAS